MYKCDTFWVSTCRSRRETTKVDNCTVKGRVSEFPFSSTMLPSPPDLGRIPNVGAGHPDKY